MLATSHSQVNDPHLQIGGFGFKRFRDRRRANSTSGSLARLFRWGRDLGLRNGRPCDKPASRPLSLPVSGLATLLTRCDAGRQLGCGDFLDAVFAGPMATGQVRQHAA